MAAGSKTKAAASVPKHRKEMIPWEEWSPLRSGQRSTGKRLPRCGARSRKGVWKKAQNVLVDGKLTWLLDEDWLWPKTITPAKQASLLCEIRKLMPPVVYATSADGVVVCMVPCTGYTRTAVNVTAEEMNELWSVKPQQRAAAQGALQYGWQHPLADPRSYNEKGERLQNVYNRKK